MDGTQIAILKQPDKMCLRGFLKGKYGRSLPAVGLAGEGQLYLPDKPRKGKAADKKVGGALVRADLLQGALS